MCHFVSDKPDISPAGAAVRSAFVAAAVLSLAAAPAPAAGGDEPVMMEPYVVVETRTELPLSAISPSTSFVPVATADVPLAPFADAMLRSLPGLTLAASGAPGSPVSLFMRGTEVNHTAVLIDGRRLNPGLAGGYDLASLTTDAVDHVEVMRGASSTLWGAEGIGGVINIVTRDARNGGGPAASLQAEVGSNETHRAGVAASGVSGAWDGTFESTWFETDNEVPNSAFELRSARATGGYTVREGVRLDVLASFSDSEGGSPGARTYPTPDDRFAQQSWSVSPGWTIDTGGAVTARGFYSFNRQRYHFVGPPWSDDLSIMANHEFDQQIDWKVSDEVLWASGVNWRQTNVRSDSFGARAFDEDQSSLGLWSQVQATLAGAWRIVLGGRRDDYSAFDSPFTWNVALHRDLPHGFSLFGKIARAYAPPTAQDLYYPGFNNPDLEPERSRDYEIGARWRSHDGQVGASAVLFRSNIDNFIQFVSRYEDGQYLGRPENVARARTQGGEFSAEARLGKRWSLQGAYTYVDAMNLSAGQRLQRRPRHQLSGAVTWRPIEVLTVSLDGRWLLAREDVSSVTYAQTDVPDYFVARFAVQWRATDNLAVFARIENLFDEQYDEIDGYAALGRTVNVGARVSF